MELTLKWVQTLLDEASTLLQLLLAIAGLFTILLPVFQTLIPCNDFVYNVYDYWQSMVYGLSKALGISRLITLARPISYYEDLTPLNYSWEDLQEDRLVSKACIAPAKHANSSTAVVSGLVNTGNSCFLNSVLQALSSLPTLHRYLVYKSETIVANIPLPVTRSLLKTLRQLSKPLYWRSSFRPTDIVAAMPSNRRFMNREQQDAHEAFQLLFNAIEAEGEKAERYQTGSRGLIDILDTVSDCNKKVISCRLVTDAILPIDNPLTGLLANRLSCMLCGYMEAIRHFPFNNIQLNLPNTHAVTLDECLQQFTMMEYLKDTTCRKCTLKTTVQSLALEIQSLGEKSSQTTDPKKKKKLLTKLVHMDSVQREIQHRLELNRIEEESHDAQLWGKSSDKTSLLKRAQRLSSKQVMIAKSPKILCLHISRSAFHSSGALYKNPCHLVFSEYLDITPYCTNGTLNTNPKAPISTSLSDAGNGKYRLMSVVVHYGNHSYGHFVTFKRRITVDQCYCSDCWGHEGVQREAWKERWHGEKEWYRISDTKVDFCSLGTVLDSNPYMLLYERIEGAPLSMPLSHEHPMEHPPRTEAYYNLPTKDALEALHIANVLLGKDASVHNAQGTYSMSGTDKLNTQWTETPSHSPIETF
ncbi:hypothetical protein BDF14DRAFT_1841845 [Spinellus fusiger]|nr:hypothetical protein BDF14DRAFT_1841845 [Spinellus fusiger]